MRLLTLSLIILLSTGCAVIKRSPQLPTKPPQASLNTLKQYQLEQPIPAGYGQYQYEDLAAYFKQGSSSRSIKLLDVRADNRTPLPGGTNCQRRTFFLLSLGLLPSICRYEKTYELEVHDRDLDLSKRHRLSFTETRTLSLFAILLAPLPQWQLDIGNSDKRASFALIEKAAQQP